MNKVVLDTNIIISAFFWKGHSRIIYDLIRVNKIRLLLSTDIEKEFIRVLGYPKFGLSAKEIFPIVLNLRACAEFVKTTSKISVITSDTTDNIFIECAVDGKADYIVSGDKHLLSLREYRNIHVVKARDFLVRERFLSE